MAMGGSMATIRRVMDAFANATDAMRRISLE
jgi:hypothetical protein